jgi:hypothetical protein
LFNDLITFKAHLLNAVPSVHKLVGTAPTDVHGGRWLKTDWLVGLRLSFLTEVVVSLRKRLSMTDQSLCVSDPFNRAN